MVREILTAAGVRFEHSRFLRMPEETHAVYFDNLDVDAADPVTAGRLPMIWAHDVTIELYEPVPDQAAEEAIEAQLIARGLSWTKQDRLWVQEAQRYQVVYEFTYHTKS